MKAALQDYYREVDEKAEQFARETETRECAEHLQAFNLGRMVQRVERVRFERWLRFGWLLVGLVIGAALGKFVPYDTYPASAQRYMARASQALQDAGRTAAEWSLR